MSNKHNLLYKTWDDRPKKMKKKNDRKKERRKIKQKCL
jgi:hypothetical protein